MNNDENQLYKEASERVKIKRDFREHRNVFVVCMIFLFILNKWTSPGYLWVKWPFLGWGLGLALHWVDTVGKLKGHRKFQTEIEHEINYMKRKRGTERIEDRTAEPFSSNDFMNSKGRDLEKKKAGKDSDSKLF